MRTARLDARLAPHGLCVLGSFAPEPGDGLPEGCAALALVGPDGGAMWPVFRAAPEYSDGRPDPLDRWSARVLTAVAAGLDGTALFPFGGPPWHPFIAWALRTGRIFASPVTLLVHDTQGLTVSFRGALALPVAIDDPAVSARPCARCADQPCRTACPPAALTPAGYDVPACRAHLASRRGADCRLGCRVRRACPVGRGLRPEGQSAFHMSAFTRSRS
ncbi:ferredoxin [Rhodobacteraceae bacterium 2CG4]|uniref:Ferredoxin n=1 Tax=Halovulum marinum TaxID=2662447 RepID=A0A6L5Z697_9RHOB|nr:ferredoxin [Halovulum marinum]MSU91610.1 ferredoxin [Halovulum marinum]